MPTALDFYYSFDRHAEDHERELESIQMIADEEGVSFEEAREIFEQRIKDAADSAIGD